MALWGHMISFEAVGNETADLLLKIINGTARFPPRRAPHTQIGSIPGNSSVGTFQKNVFHSTRWFCSKGQPCGSNIGLLLATTGVFIGLTMVLGALLLQIRGSKTSRGQSGT
jgi:hypothetical protein